MDRFWAKVEKTDTCWWWTGCKVGKGYGGFSIGGRLLLAHRVAYELMREEIPPGLTIDHLCGHIACVNPDHLEVVTMRENIARSSGITAQNMRKTECPQGHPYDEANTYTNSQTGRRHCRACHRDHKRRYRRAAS